MLSENNSKQHQPISVNSIQPVINVIIIELIPGNARVLIPNSTDWY